MITRRLTTKNAAAFILAAVLATGATAITVQAGNAAQAAVMGVETPDLINLLDDAQGNAPDTVLTKETT